MKKFLKGIQYCSLTILFIFLILFLIGFTSRTSVVVLLKEDNLDKLVKSVSIMDLLRNEAGNYTVKGKDIHDVIAKTGIPEAAIEDFLESDATKELMTEYTKTSLDYLVSGKELPKLDSEEIVTTFEQAMNEIVSLAKEKELPYASELTEARQEQVVAKVKTLVPEIEEKIPDAENWLLEKLEKQEDIQDKLDQLKKAEAKLQAIRKQATFFFSNSVTMIWIGILALNIFLLLLIRFSKTAWLLWLGLAFSIAGTIIVFLGSFLSSVVSFFYQVPSTFQAMVDEAIALLSSGLIQNGYICLIPGLVMLFVLGVIRFIQMKKENKRYEQI